MSTWFFVVLAGLFLLGVYNALKQHSQLRYIKQYRFHPMIKQKLRVLHPQLSESELDVVINALRDYFYICNKAKRRMVAMPSQIVDDAWHEFILYTKGYQAFCQRSFGRFLHHTPAQAMTQTKDIPVSIRRAWRLACVKEGINTQKPERLPLLFAIDAQFAVPGGFYYSLNCVPGDNRYCASSIGCGGSSCGSCCSDSGCSGGGCSGGCGGGGD